MSLVKEKAIQATFDNSGYNEVFVKDIIFDSTKNEVVATLAYPNTYDLSRSIFDIFTDLKEFDVLYKMTTSRGKHVEIWHLKFH